MFPADLGYSLSELALCCGFQHEKEIGEERGSWGLLLFLLFVFLSFFFFLPKMLFGQVPFQNLADVQSNSQCLSKGHGSWTPNPPRRRPGTKPWQRAPLWGFGSVQSNRSSQAEPNNSKMPLLLPLSHLPPSQHGCSQASCSHLGRTA